MENPQRGTRTIYERRIKMGQKDTDCLMVVEKEGGKGDLRRLRSSFSDFLEVCPDSVRKAIRTKRLKAVKINRMGAWRIPREELERFMRGE